MKNIVVVIVGLVLVSCGQSSFETSKGTVVQYLKEGNGSLPADSLVGLYHFRYALAGGEVLVEPDINNPAPFKVDPSQAVAQGEVYEIIALLRAGDSVRFEMTALALFGPQKPDSIVDDQMIDFQIAVVDIMTDQAYGQYQRDLQVKLSAEQDAIDAEIIDNYLTENSIVAESTPSGLRYKIHEQGTGRKPVSGEMVEVDYTGQFLSGEVFDTSNAERAQEAGVFNPGRTYEPYAFALETGSVIQGWHIGIAELNVGTKATLYIPSSLAYGSRGGRIPANSVLVFDVELVGIQ
ncbi:MAG: FKBP-type peptidyl-prolyl cis-trans isomerase [Cyclobacteriaceae bacterium]